MKSENHFKRDIVEVKDVKLQRYSPIHTAGPVIEPGNWEKSDPFLFNDGG